MDINICKATLEDSMGINQLYIQLFAMLADLQPNYFKEGEQDIEFVHRIVNQNSSDVLLAKNNDDIVGFLIIEEVVTPPYTCIVSHKYAYIIDFVVDAKYRGVGVGQLLMQAARKWATDRGLDYLELRVLSENVKARHFYEEFGFQDSSLMLKLEL